MTIFFSRRWIGPTLAVVLGMAFLTRLGFWQLDRLEWRRGLNAETAAQLALPPLDLNTASLEEINELPPNRQLVARGQIAVDEQVFVAQQRYNGRSGYHLLAPLQLEGREEALLINRGWVPADALSDLSAYSPAPGTSVEISGYAAQGERLPSGLPATFTPQREISIVDLSTIDANTQVPLLPIYALENVPGRSNPPIPVTPDIDLDEGNHLSYAIQWFAFAILLGILYLYYVLQYVPRREATRRKRSRYVK